MSNLGRIFQGWSQRSSTGGQGLPRTITLRFPFPPGELSPNVSVHHMTKARKVKEYRDTCGWLAKGQLQPTPITLASPVLASVTFGVTDKRRRDLDNLMASIKPLWDGMVDADVLQDDSTEHLRHAESKLVVGDEKYVEVELREVE